MTIALPYARCHTTALQSRKKMMLATMTPFPTASVFGNPGDSLLMVCCWTCPSHIRTMHLNIGYKANKLQWKNMRNMRKIGQMRIYVKLKTHELTYKFVLYLCCSLSHCF